jgi:hypothetical protein
MKVISKERNTAASAEVPDSKWTPSDSAALAKVVHAASDAVAALADRLNALALRAALLGGIANSFGTDANIESYLNRLTSLVGAAGEQMRRIQTVLHVLETNTLEAESKRQRTPSRNINDSNTLNTER